MIRAALISALLALAACGPMSPERATEICTERARNAAGPTGEIGIGVNSEKGVVTNAEVKITSDFIRGRDPQVVYDQCIRNLTGQGPVRPLVLGR